MSLSPVITFPDIVLNTTFCIPSDAPLYKRILQSPSSCTSNITTLSSVISIVPSITEFVFRDPALLVPGSLDIAPAVSLDNAFLAYLYDPSG